MPESRLTRRSLSLIFGVVALLCLHTPLSAQVDQQGAYADDSAEQYFSLARLKVEEHSLEEASAAYQEGLQALRITQGLATESQLRVLPRYNDVLLQTRNWEQLDTNLHLALDITGRLYGTQDERYVDAATALANWKIRAYQTHVFRARGDRSVREAAEIYRVLLDRLPQDNDSVSRRAAFLSAKGLAHFYSAQHVAGIPVNEFQGVSATGLAPQYCVPLIMAVDGAMPAQISCNDGVVQDPEYYAAKQREKSREVRRHLGNMRQSFQEAVKLVESDPGATLRDRALATLNLGDANLLAEDYPRARSQYAKAWKMLGENADSVRLREELMGSAVKVLDGILEFLPESLVVQGEGVEGQVSFDVTETGEIVNINVTGGAAALEQENISAIAIRLDQSIYRPRIEAGRPVASRVTIAATDL